jgi:mRNA interferase RelE/StbE
LPTGGRYRIRSGTTWSARSRQLRRLPPGDAARLRGPILALGIDSKPTGAAKLVGTDFWRLRVGDVRIVYLVDGDLVVVLKVARRSESTYRQIER